MNRKILIPAIGVAVTLALALAAYLAIPLFVSTVSLKGEIEARVARATGRTFHINGPLTISLFPSLARSAMGPRKPYRRHASMHRISR